MSPLIGSPRSFFRSGVAPSLGPQHMPPGATIITPHPFTALNAPGWISNGNYALVSDPTAPFSPPSVGQMTFFASLAQGTAPGNVSIQGFGGLGTFTTLHVCLWHKFSANWFGQSQGINKVLYAGFNRVASPGGGFNQTVFNVGGAGNGALSSGMNSQGMGAVPGGSLNQPHNLAPGVITRDQWFKWEAVLTMNTPGVQDGVIDWWIDDIATGHYANLGWREVGENHKWEIIKWQPTYGGNGGSPPYTMQSYMDHIFLSGVP